MLHRVRLRSLPVSRLMRPRSHISQPIHHNFRLGPQCQHQQARSFHYDPNAVVFQLPFKTRLKYMTYGAVWLLALGGGFVGYRLYGLHGQRDALGGELKNALDKLKAFNEQFATGFAQARAAGDHHRLRQLTFDLLRQAQSDTETGRLPEQIVEFGELPGLPFDDPRSGGELVPREDTLVLLEKDEDDRIAACHVAANLEMSEVYRGLADPKPEQEADKLLELFRRVGDQIELWRRQDRLFEDEKGQVDLVILFCLREETWAFEYAEGHWNSLSGPISLVEQSASVIRAEEMLEQMSSKEKGLFGSGRKPRS
ncbi:hypothetical protein SCUP515_06821 [Seiridium cupressi]